MKFLEILSLAVAVLSIFTGLTTAETFIIDNDTPTALQFLMPLTAGKKVAGIATNIGDYDVDTATYEGALSLLPGNLTSCILIYKGAAKPLLRTNETYQLWQQLYGSIVWQGVWAPDYESSLAEGIEYIFNDTIGAPQWILDTVKGAEDDITIVAAGTMTNLAIALSQWPELASRAKLVIMGGYVDNQIAQVTGGDFINDLYTDFNLMMDPEAAQTTLSASWKELVIVGNISSEIFPTQDLYDRLIAQSDGLLNVNQNASLAYVKETIGDGIVSSSSLPFWDEVASAIAACPEIVTGSYEAYVSVETSFSSPFYGSLRMVPKDLRPSKGVATGLAKMITSVDEEKFYSIIIDSLVRDWTAYCETGISTSLKLFTE